MDITSIGWGVPVYADPAAGATSSMVTQAEAAKAFDVMIFRLLLQSVNLFGLEQSGTPWGGLWQGALADQWAQELATQHALSFGATLFNGEEEGRVW